MNAKALSCIEAAAASIGMAKRQIDAALYDREHAASHIRDAGMNAKASLRYLAQASDALFVPLPARRYEPGEEPDEPSPIDDSAENYNRAQRRLKQMDNVDPDDEAI